MILDRKTGLAVGDIGKYPSFPLHFARFSRGAFRGEPGLVFNKLFIGSVLDTRYQAWHVHSYAITMNRGSREPIDGSRLFDELIQQDITVNGAVALHGMVKTEQEKNDLAANAKQVDGVTEVNNQLEVKNPKLKDRTINEKEMELLCQKPSSASQGIKVKLKPSWTNSKWRASLTMTSRSFFLTNKDRRILLTNINAEDISSTKEASVGSTR